MPAEEIQEIGRDGVERSKRLLFTLFGSSLALPFNAYDHPKRLRFQNPAYLGGGSFSFDLRGSLEASGEVGLGEARATEVLVEVKTYEHGDSLLQKFAEFLRNAAVVSLDPQHGDTQFIFLASVPFGSSRGRELCDGRYLSECSAKWPKEVHEVARDLHLRVCLLIATKSFERMILEWSAHV